MARRVAKKSIDTRIPAPEGEAVGGPLWWRRTIIAIDPGVTTGLALFRFPPKSASRPVPPVIETIQFDTKDEAGALELATFVVTHKPHHLIIEQYVTRPSVHGSVGNRHQVELSPIWVAGQLLGYYAGKYKKPAPEVVPIHWQQAGLAMGAMPPKRLKTLFPGLYKQTAGQPHARDALIHGLRWLKAERNDLFMRVSRD